MSSMPPKQKPGRSEQVVETPDEFIRVVEERIQDMFTWDLAASESNHKALHFYTESSDSLQQNWQLCGGWCWCNPPYSDISPWVEKASESREDSRIVMLVPSSTGSNWWRDYVDGMAHVIFLNGRITFVGHISPYPKDLALLLYTPLVKGGYEVWDWS